MTKQQKEKLIKQVRGMKKLTSERKLINKYKDTPYEDFMGDFIPDERARNISYNQALYDVAKLIEEDTN